MGSKCANTPTKQAIIEHALKINLIIEKNYIFLIYMIHIAYINFKTVISIYNNGSR